MKQIDNSVKITLIIVSAVILLFLLGMWMYLRVNPSATISTNGQSIIKVTPDLVSIYFNVETEGDTAQEAKDKNSEIIGNVKSAIVLLGLSEKEIATENYNIYPDYSWENNRQVLKGYKASHSLKVKLEENKMDLAGRIIDAGVDSGALIGWINFELTPEKQSEYKTQALKEATEDARTKGESIASGLGKKLGRIVTTTDSGFDYYPWPIYQRDVPVASEAKEALTSIQPGEQEINARVSVVWAVK